MVDLSETAAKQGLENFVARAASASSAHIISIRRLGARAVSETRVADVSIHGSRLDGEHALVVRADAQSRGGQRLLERQVRARLQVSNPKYPATAS